jgi:adenosylmethionine-8-amino-7-oxononanoate aminotransferase
MFGVNHWGVIPDIMTVAKGLVSSYMPIGATIVRNEIADFFAGGENYLKHVFTFSGHPVSAAAALANIKIIEQEKLVENSRKTGSYFKDKLEGFKNKHQIIGDVRGRGLLLAMELVSDRKTKEEFNSDIRINELITGKFYSRGIIFRVSTNILNIAPPLCITRDEVDEICMVIDEVLTELGNEL